MPQSAIDFLNQKQSAVDFLQQKKPDKAEEFVIRDNNFLVDYYHWLHTPTEPPKGNTFIQKTFDFINRVVPKSISSTAVGLAEFPYLTIKSFTDPMLEYAKDIVQGEGIKESSKEFTYKVGQTVWDLALGMSHFFGEPTGMFGWEALKKAWGTNPAASVLAVTPLARGVKALERTRPIADFGEKGNILQRVYDKIDVKAPFNRVGAEATGEAFRTYESIRTVEQQRALQAAKSMDKLKLTAEEGELVTLRASNSPRTENITNPRIVEGGEIVRRYFDEAYERLHQDKVLAHPWPEGHILRNNRTIIELEERLQNTPAGRSRTAIESQINELNEINTQLREIDPKYVHIPLSHWFSQIRNALGENQANTLINTAIKSRFFKGRFFRQRKSIDIGDVMDWMREMEQQSGIQIFDPQTFDVRTIMSNYANMVGISRGLGRVFNAAKNDGLIIPDAMADSLPNYGSAPLELQLRFPELKGKQIHNAFLERLKDLTQRESTELGRLFGYTKIMAFYNPVFLPAYDLWQASWVGSIRSLKTPLHVARAIKSSFKKDTTYYEASEAGAFSHPYTPPFVDFMRDMRKHIHAPIYEKLAARAKEFKDPYHSIDTLYRPVWDMAWAGDQAIRMITYNYLKDKGFSPEVAGQMTAYFHADYARIRPPARKVLNKIFFTPSFKYVMSHLQANMVKSSINILNDASNLKIPSARDTMLVRGGVALMAGMIAKDYLMQRWGFTVENFGTRYHKEVETDEGVKDLVLYWSDPNNVLLRQYHKWSKWRDDPEHIAEFVNKLHWDLHPIWATAYEIISNSKIGEPRNVYNPFDNDTQIAFDIAHHLVSKIFAMEGQFERLISEKGVEAGYDALIKDLGKVKAGILMPMVLTHLRNTKEIIAARRIQDLNALFNKFLRYDEPKNQDEMQTRLDNFYKEIEDIYNQMEELK